MFFASRYNDGYATKMETGKFNENKKYVVTGFYEYENGDKLYRIHYTADENGYHPKVTIIMLQLPMIIEIVSIYWL